MVYVYPLMLKDQVVTMLDFGMQITPYNTLMCYIMFICFASFVRQKLVGFKEVAVVKRGNAIWLISLFFRGIFRKGTTKKKSWSNCFGPGMWKRWRFAQVEEGEN